MLSFIAWYLLVSALGWLTFPLVFRLFPALADRGFSLARTFGMLVWGYAFWMMASLGIIQNDIAGLLLGLILLIACSGSALVRKETRKSLVDWIGSNLHMILVIEILFFLAFAAWAFVRASNPNIEIRGGEKTMELAFINAILRSPSFPPHDPWLSGYAISYYYFGYVLTAMLAKATGTLGSVAFNLMISLVFALSALGAYGVLYNLLAAWRRKHQLPGDDHHPLIGLPLLGPLFLLFVSNLEGFLVLLHRQGLFWSWGSDGKATSSFWSWLGILQMSDPPSHPGLFPDQFNWWWRASRIIQDLDLAKNSTEIIDEFPAFSYLLGDLHPHVLAMPFGLLAIAVALNLFLGGWKGETNLYFYRLPVQASSLFFGAIVLGGLAFLNTWDILIGFSLLISTYVLTQVIESGWSWKRVDDVFALGMPLGLLAILLYLPFYFGFSSQAGGVLPNVISPTRGVHLWVMFGPLFLPIFAYLIYLWRSGVSPSRWKSGLSITLGIAFFLWFVSWVLAFVAYKLQPGFVGNLIKSQCSGNIALCFGLATLRRLSYIGGFLTLFGLLVTALAFIIPIRDQSKTVSSSSFSIINPMSFVLMLIIFGALLVIVPDFIFLRDLFNNRSNTIFKFYYQAWLLWSVTAAFGTAVLLQNLRRVLGWIFRAGLLIVMFMALVFPALGLPEKTNDFQIHAFNEKLKLSQVAGVTGAIKVASSVWTLDGSQLFSNQYPDDAAAARWLLAAPAGVIAEAVSVDAYSDFGRMAVYSGLPTVLGWYWHEYQWRGTDEPQGTRQEDIRRLYETSNWEDAQAILTQYEIRYVCVGTLERSSYHLNESKFQRYLLPKFQQGQVTIYEVP